MKCRKCHRDVNQIKGYLQRVNAKGQPGVWECRPHCLSNLSPDDAVVAAVMSDEEPPE